MVLGARLALAEARGHVGEYRIALKVLDDATVARGGWDPGQTTINAKVAVLDPTTIAYLGELNSGASAVSIPPLNRAGIPQVSPTSTAVGLTTSAPGAFPGEPQKYYPSGIRTFARVVPNDTVQAVAQVRVQKSMGCTRTYVLDDDEVDGADAARSFALAAQSAGLRLVGDPGVRARRLELHRAGRGSRPDPPGLRPDQRRHRIGRRAVDQATGCRDAGP